MGQTNYIVAIELSSSKIKGAVGIETYNGITILATASTPVDGFISKGVVRNVDKTSEAISYIINSLEPNLKSENGNDIAIKKAYVSLAGLSIRSIKSKIVRTFDTYTKITADIISEMELENDATFQVPEGYARVQVVNQEYKIDGKVDHQPIGAPAMNIEGNYLNIIIKEQFLEQLNESFAQAKTEIVDSFIAARMDADIMLGTDARHNGCALVNIGYETTTVTIYNNDHLRKIAVLPLGSKNITRDLCAEQISYAEAEAIKITRGYKSDNNEKEPIDSETVNNIINARMSEILQNVKYQIEDSHEAISNIIFTGGGAKLKNLNLLLDEYLPNFKCEIAAEPQLTFECKPGINTYGIFTTALYGLLNRGKENCCEEDTPKAPANPGELFDENEMNGNDTPQPEKKQPEKTPANDNANNKGKDDKEKEKNKGKGKGAKGDNWITGLFGGFKDFLKEATSEDEKTNDIDND